MSRRVLVLIALVALFVPDLGRAAQRRVTSRLRRPTRMRKTAATPVIKLAPRRKVAPVQRLGLIRRLRLAPAKQRFELLRKQGISMRRTSDARKKLRIKSTTVTAGRPRAACLDLHMEGVVRYHSIHPQVPTGFALFPVAKSLDQGGVGRAFVEFKPASPGRYLVDFLLSRDGEACIKINGQKHVFPVGQPASLVFDVPDTQSVWISVFCLEKKDPTGHDPGNASWGFDSCRVSNLAP